VAGQAYADYIREHDSYGDALRRLELTERGVTGQLVQLQRAHRSELQGAAAPAAGTPAARVTALLREVQELRMDRTERRGLLFPDEATTRASAHRTRELGYYARALGIPDDEAVLTPEEAQALSSGEHGAAGEALVQEPTSLWTRLQMVRNLQTPAGPGRLPAGIMRLDPPETFLLGRDDRPVALVGLVAEPRDVYGLGGSTQIHRMVDVIPLNQAATERLGTNGVRNVMYDRLAPAFVTDLPRSEEE
jgi:hypothetical protein